MNRIARLLGAYEAQLGLGWDSGLHGAERTWFAVYDPADERRLRAMIGEFELATDKSGYSTFDFPSASALMGGTVALGIDGERILGAYVDGSNNVHGYLYDGKTFTSIDAPLGTYTAAKSISGNTVVGFYYDVNGNQHGFLYGVTTLSFSTFDVSPQNRGEPGGRRPGL